MDDYYSRETVKQGDLKKIIKKHKVSESAFLERIQTLGRNPVTVTASGKEKVPFTTKEKNQIKANFELPEGVKKWDFDNHKYGLAPKGVSTLTFRTKKLRRYHCQIRETYI